MRWYIEISPVGKSEVEQRFCLEAPHWQPALQQARSLRGDGDSLGGVSVDFTENGCRATDASKRVRYVVSQANDGAALVESTLNATAEAKAASNGAAKDDRETSATTASTSRGSTNGGKRERLGKRRGSRSKRRRLDEAKRKRARKSSVDLGDASDAAATKPAGKTRPGGVEAAEAPRPAAKQKPARPKNSNTVLGIGGHAGNISADRWKLLGSQALDGDGDSPISYREVALGLRSALSLIQAEQLLREQLEVVREELGPKCKGVLVDIALFDHVYVDSAERPPVVTLQWADWRGDPAKVAFLPYSDKPCVSAFDAVAALGQQEFDPNKPAPHRAGLDAASLVKAAEEKRKAEEAQAAEEKRKAEEALAAERKRKADEARAAEKRRRDEAAKLAAAKAAERKRKADEKRAAVKAKVAEEKRVAAEAKAAAEKAAEEKRLAAAKVAAEKKRLAEKAQAAVKKAAEAKAAEAKAAEAKAVEEKAAEAKAAEEKAAEEKATKKRLAEEAQERAAEEKRIVDEAEAAEEKAAEEKARAAEAADEKAKADEANAAAEKTAAEAVVLSSAKDDKGAAEEGTSERKKRSKRRRKGSRRAVGSRKSLGSRKSVADAPVKAVKASAAVEVVPAADLAADAAAPGAAEVQAAAAALGWSLTPRDERFEAARARASSMAPTPSKDGERTAADELIADLFDAMADLHFHSDSIEAAQFVLGVAMEKLPSKVGLVSLFDIDRREYVVVHQLGGQSSGVLLCAPQTMKLSQRAMRKKRAVLSDDEETLKDPRWLATGVAVRQVLCAPAQLHGRYLGLIEMADPYGAPFGEAECNALTYIANQFAEFLANTGMLLDPDVIVAYAEQSA